jgi:tetratricopeptide (TPR) repeat protein
LLRQGKTKEARAVAERLLAIPLLRGEGTVIRVKAAVAEGDVAGAWRELARAEKETPHDLDPLQGLCQVLFERGDWAEAERALKEFVRRSPRDGSAYHNLGTVYHRSGRTREAVGAYRQALLYRPDWSTTYLRLGSALLDCGLIGDAIAAWEQAQRLDPQDAEAREMIARAKGVKGR